MSKPESAYADTAKSYEFSAQYLKWFEPLARGEPIIAIIYEPHSRGAGRQAFVGWASISSAPRRSARTTAGGRALWEVVYDDYVHEFATPVRRDIAGEPIEGWLRDVAVEHRDIRTSGRSVRALDDVELGFGAQDATLVYPERIEHIAESLVADRPGDWCPPWSGHRDSGRESSRRTNSGARLRSSARGRCLKVG
jgi:hypothetical protein